LALTQRDQQLGGIARRDRKLGARRFERMAGRRADRGDVLAIGQCQQHPAVRVGVAPSPR
jgi:hypothetical protein